MRVGIALRRYGVGLGCLAASLSGSWPGAVQAQSTIPSINGQCVLSTVLQGDTQAAGTLQTTCGQMWSGHLNSVTIRLQDGSVLVAGGVVPAQFGGGVSITNAEAYLPQEGIFIPVGAKQYGAYIPESALLGNGQVLIIDDLNGSEVYTPSLLGFQKVGSILNPGQALGDSTLTAFGQGNALVAGGYANGKGLAAAEVYSASTQSFALTGSLNQGRFNHSAVALADGRILVVGGFSSFAPSVAAPRAEIYNPATGTFTLAASLITPRGNAYAVLLPNGRVLVAGGSSGGQSLASAEIYDPASDSFSATGAMLSPQSNDDSGIQSFIMPNGKVLVGNEIYDPASGSFSLAPGQPPLGAPMAMLLSGQVLLTGAYSANPAPAYLYQPPR